MSAQLVILIIGLLWFLLTYLLLFYYFSGSVEKEEIKSPNHGNLRNDQVIINDKDKWPSNIVTHSYDRYIYPNFTYKNTHRVNIKMEEGMYLGVFMICPMVLDDIKNQIQINTMINMKRMENEYDSIKTIIFTRETYYQDKSSELGLEWTTDYTSNEYGTPFIFSFYDYAYSKYNSTFYCYMNADLLFTSDLYRNMVELNKLMNENILNRRILGVGRRMNQNITFNDKVFVLHPDKADEEIIELNKTASLFFVSALDYFLLTRVTYNWSDIPPFVIGRVRYDNYLLEYAIKSNVIDTLDLTETLLCLHQTGTDGIKAGWRKKEGDKKYNIRLMKRMGVKVTRRGTTPRTKYYSTYENNQFKIYENYKDRWIYKINP